MQANVQFRPIQPVKKYPKRLELKLQVASRYKIRVCATYLNFDKVNVVEELNGWWLMVDGWFRATIETATQSLLIPSIPFLLKWNKRGAIWPWKLYCQGFTKSESNDRRNDGMVRWNKQTHTIITRIYFDTPNFYFTPNSNPIHFYSYQLTDFVSIRFIFELHTYI